MTEQDSQKPTQEPDYGTVGTAQAQNVKKGHRGAIIIGLVIAALVAAGVAVYLFTQGTFNEPVVETVQRVPLSEERALAALEEADMAAPDISKYAYVSQDDLIGPKFSDVKVAEPVDLGAPANVVVECTVTATATFKNKGVEINVPVTLPFDYSVDSETWVPGDLTRGDVTSKPLASAKASEIVEHLDTILYEHDPTYGEEMAEASVVKTSSDLSIDGGPITVELSKQAEVEKDKKKYNQLRTCTVELAVTWANDAGWQVAVADAGQIDRKDVPVPTDEEAEGDKGSNEQQAEVTAAEVKPVKLGKVKFGDTVKLSGTLEKIGKTKASKLAKDNDYSNKDASDDADGDVQFVLKFNQPVTMTLDGKKYEFTTLPVAVSGVSKSQMKTLDGFKVEYVEGPLEESFATSWAPAGIKALNIKQAG